MLTCRDETLGAVDNVVIAVTIRQGQLAHGIGACLWLCHGKCTNEFARSQRFQVGFSLLVRAEAFDETPAGCECAG